MKIPSTPFTVVQLARLERTLAPGETGRSFSRAAETPDVRLRLVVYEAGYLADHWCDRGHILYVIDGELTVELQDGRAVALQTGDSFVVSDRGDSAHRVRSERGASVFIAD
jgi:quercetin dioxygenase-like cupin family protein